ncbi:MAG: hypothetical protein KJZ47_07110, partial [Gemmatimonadales bacterium]|nr:hypothetical protein [Gemmatimonadales bacterium]
MRRPESRRRGQDHQVDVGGQHLLVGIESGERHLIGHLVHRGERGILAGAPGQVGAGAGQPVGEEVAHRHQLDVVARAKAVGDGTSTTATASDDTHPNRVHVGGRCPEVPRHRQAGSGRPMTDWVKEIAQAARHTLAVGSCAAWGGVAA